MSDVAAPTILNDLFRRLRLSLAWVMAQFWAMLLLMLAGIAWTRLPDKYTWQVVLSLLLPLVLFALALLLQAGTMRKLLNQEQERVLPAMGALTLVVWTAIVWAVWTILNWCDDQIPLWAGYLNSRFGASGRASVFTYEHLQSWLTLLVWILRWIVVPAKVIPHAVASAQWGWRLPWRRLIRVLLNWQWWLAAVIASLIGVALPGHFFSGVPHGTVAHQVWAVMLKLGGAYLLAIASWVLLLAWAAVLIARQPQPAEGALDQQLLQRLYAGRGWIAGLAVWTLFLQLCDAVMAHLPENVRSIGWIIVSLLLVLMISFLLLNVALLRCMIGPGEKRRQFLWGMLMAAWALPGLIAAFLLSRFHCPASFETLLWVLIGGMFIPFAAASAQWGARLPWRRVLRILPDWRWWIGVLYAAIVGWEIPSVLLPGPAGVGGSPQSDLFTLRRAVSIVLSMGSWVVLLGWFTVLLARTQPSTRQPGGDSLVPAPVGSGPLSEDPAKLPLPESGGDAGGEA